MVAGGCCVMDAFNQLMQHPYARDWALVEMRPV